MVFYPRAQFIYYRCICLFIYLFASRQPIEIWKGNYYSNHDNVWTHCTYSTVIHSSILSTLMNTFQSWFHRAVNFKKILENLATLCQGIKFYRIRKSLKFSNLNEYWNQSTKLPKILQNRISWISLQRFQNLLMRIDGWTWRTFEWHLRVANAPRNGAAEEIKRRYFFQEFVSLLILTAA
jgi:hypothetical protein